MSLRHYALGIAFAFLAALAVPARAAVDVQIAGNTATASLPAAGTELILTFDGVSNLSPANLGISARLLGPLEVLALASRLPDARLTSLPLQLPLLVTVEPPAAGALGLTNTVRVELHTHLLPYTAGSPFRLFKAPLGGRFVDITDEIAPGSVRARGTTGGFSEFLVLTDLRPTSQVIDGKFAALRARLQAVPGELGSELTAELDAAEAAVIAGRWSDAIAAVDAFRARVSSVAGHSLANVWTTTARDGNVAGDLLAGAATLRFSIGYLRDYGS